MLVLSRREAEKVLFPTLGISIEVLRSQGNTTRLGIDAPPDIPILRHEMMKGHQISMTPDANGTKLQLRELAVAVRRRLDSAANALNQLHVKLDENQDEMSQEIVLRLYRDLQKLEQEANQALEWSSAARSLQVMVVEDNASERKLLAGVLELSGLQVTTAVDGRDALEYLSLHACPDAVLLDMHMPRCNGRCFVKEVRANTELAGIKVFAVSGADPNSLGLEIGDGGIDGWFPKPLDPGELVSALDKRLGHTASSSK